MNSHMNDIIRRDLSNAERAISQKEEQLNLAKRTYLVLVKYIQEFENALDNDHEIGARLVSFGSTVTFQIENIGHASPDVICFYGQSENNQKVQLIQNISQLSVLLIGIKKTDENPPKRIGYNLPKE